MTAAAVSARHQPARSTVWWWVGVVLAVVVLSSALLVARGWRPGERVARAPASATVPTSTELEETYGIRVVGVDLTGSDGMLQLRYQVLDADKAHAVHDDATAPAVLAGGRTLDEPGIAGHGGHKVAVDAGAAGVVLIANTGHAVSLGDIVTVRMGELRLDGIPVD